MNNPKGFKSAAKKCASCNKSLRGRQRKFCSRRCKNADTNKRHQSYVAQQQRGRKRKLALIHLKGAKCELCGYRTNYAALQLHHPNPLAKKFQLDIRALSNRRWDAVLEESRKCTLLCANCHAEEHNPDCMVSTQWSAQFETKGASPPEPDAFNRSPLGKKEGLLSNFSPCHDQAADGASANCEPEPGVRLVSAE
jgi:hypothetical protein